MGTMMAERGEREVAEYNRYSAPPAMPDKPTLRPDEVALILGCSDVHVRHLVEDGSLAAVDIRCKFLHRPAWRIMRNSVAEFIQKRRTI